MAGWLVHVASYTDDKEPRRSSLFCAAHSLCACFSLSTFYMVHLKKLHPRNRNRPSTCTPASTVSVSASASGTTCSSYLLLKSSSPPIDCLGEGAETIKTKNFNAPTPARTKVTQRLLETESQRLEQAGVDVGGSKKGGVKTLAQRRLRTQYEQLNKGTYLL